MAWIQCSVEGRVSSNEFDQAGVFHVLPDPPGADRATQGHRRDGFPVSFKATRHGSYWEIWPGSVIYEDIKSPDLMFVEWQVSRPQRVFLRLAHAPETNVPPLPVSHGVGEQVDDADGGI